MTEAEEQLTGNPTSPEKLQLNDETLGALEALIDKLAKERGIVDQEDTITCSPDVFAFSSIGIGRMDQHPTYQAVASLMQGIAGRGTKAGIRVFSGDVKRDVKTETELYPTIAFYSTYTPDREEISRAADDLASQTNFALRTLGSQIELPSSLP